MENKDKIRELAGKSLGSSNSYAVYTDHYDKTLLNPLPRELNRETWGIDPTRFVGFDVWRCWESTFLTKNGLPVAGTLKIVYSAQSKFIIESKSFKLFLNTFDQMRLGDGSIQSATEEYLKLVGESVSEALESKAEVQFFPADNNRQTVDFQSQYVDLMKAIPNVEELVFDDYKAEKQHLSVVPESSSYHQDKYWTNIGRSRCCITSQKDSSDVFVIVETENSRLDPASLLKQIVSIREIDEFHEPCCEKLYNELINTPGVIHCAVMMLYVRRGSLDINPIRASKPELLTKELIDVDIFTQKTQAQ